MGPSPGNWLAAHRADFTLGKTVIYIFVAKFYSSYFVCVSFWYVHVSSHLFPPNRSPCGVIDKPLYLYPGVPSSIPGSNETLSCDPASLSLAVGGTSR